MKQSSSLGPTTAYVGPVPVGNDPVAATVRVVSVQPRDGPGAGVDDDRAPAEAAQRYRVTLGRPLAERSRQIDAVREELVQAQRVHERVHVRGVVPGPGERSRVCS